MNKEKIINVCNYLSEYSLYVVIVAVTFSSAFMYVGLVFLIGSWLTKNIILKKFVVPATGANWLLIAFLAWNVLSIFISTFPLESIKGAFKVLRYLVLFWAVFDIVDSRKIFKRLTIVILVSSSVIAIDGLIQYFLGFDLLRHKVIDPLDYLHRIQASFRHSNDFGVYLVLIIPMFISLIFSPILKRKKKIILIVFLLLLLFCLVNTQSRGAWLGFIFAILLLGILKGRKFFFWVIFILAAVYLISPYSFKNRIYSLFKPEQNTVWERVKLWEGTINMIKEKPIIGFGVNTFSKNYPKYRPSDYSDLRYTHNCYLQMASEIGITGAGMFLLIMILFFIKGIKLIKKNKLDFERAVSIGLLSGLLGFLVHSGLDTHLYSAVLLITFWFAWGMFFASSRFKEIS